MNPLRDAFDYIRGVSGWGPRCGCGGKSKVHIGDGSPKDAGIFLCASCVSQMVRQWFADFPDQPAHWPGDEDRDEHYVDPRERDGHA